MESPEKLSNRARFVSTLLTAGTVFIAMLSYFVAIYLFYNNSFHSIEFLLNRDFLISCIFITLIWSTLEIWFGLNEVYRSRSYGYIVLYHIAESIIGVIVFTFALFLFGLPNYGRDVLLTFGAFSTILAILFKFAFYLLLRRYRRTRARRRKARSSQIPPSAGQSAAPAHVSAP